MNTRHDKQIAPPSNRRASMAGFSIIEMMISITIGLMIITALVGVLTSNASSSKTNDLTSELQTNGRYALDHLKRELRHARYRGYTWADPNVPAIINVANECGGAASGFVINILQGVWGANEGNPGNPYAANCMSNANLTYLRPYLRGDVLVLRRVANAPTATADLVANTLYFRSTYAMGEVFQGMTPPAAITGTPIANFALQEYVYYIGSDDVDTTVPALRRVALQGNAMVDEMVVSGIEQMQVQYGRATTDLNTQYYNANNIAGTSTNTAPTDWDDVNSVRIWLLARNAKVETGYTNTNVYAMGDQNYDPVDDSFRRQLFTTVVQLRNLRN